MPMGCHGSQFETGRNGTVTIRPEPQPNRKRYCAGELQKC